MSNFLPRSLLYLMLLAALLAGCASTEKPKSVLPVVPSTSKGNARAVVDALNLQGHPYAFGGDSPQEGFDCSGLVVYVFNQQGIKLPRTVQMLAQRLPDVQPEQRLPGDLLFFNIDKPFSHVGIYVGHDHFVHASSTHSGRVMVSNLQQPYWRERFMAVRRPHANRALSMFEPDESICPVN